MTKKNWRFGILFLALGSILGGIGLLTVRGGSPTGSSSTASPAPDRPMQKQPLHYQVYTLPKSVVYTLQIPAHGQFQVVPALSQNVDRLENFAHKNGAIAVINGGFFDPMNQKSTSYVMQQGKQVADPKLNERLVNNPDLTPYLNQIFDRSEFRRYRCGQDFRYAIARHNAPLPEGCQLVDALGAGPQLLPTMTAVQEGFLDEANGVVLRDSLGSQQPNARSAIGITSDGSVVWVMVAQKTEDPTDSGMSLPELANFMKTLGVKEAINLDGGSSSSFYYEGKTVYGKVNQAGERVERSVKSVLFVRGQEPEARSQN
ncbi:phosphodiester glycosidase family protein [Kovacikia minuta CCNUW1]|uniref:phosphodiester glycosidase family protein n=1 Tax=Kovacikia minuta TaxID=2931930 RepID=UPI001CCF95C6|nr:phosphodiester glycosidase family protein [Kovacikia minuta]UBF27373.1 phosphodiester glycosidase family protein [Kovacikia minuta CCNUW1]